MVSLTASVVVDTSVLLDYLNGERRAERALAAHPHRSISVVSWLELMAVAPPELTEATRGFLRGFERLSISEAIADEALALMNARPGLPLHRALTWATARVNRLTLLTVDARDLKKNEPGVELPYRWAAGAERAMPSANAKPSTA